MTNGLTISLVVGSFHQASCEIMVKKARSTAGGLGLQVRDEVWVPGSMEKPLATKRLLEQSVVDAVVVLGIIERGETAHGRVMGQAVIKSLIDLQLATNKPVGVGILGPEILPEQTPPRLAPYAEAAVKAVHAMLVS